MIWKAWAQFIGDIIAGMAAPAGVVELLIVRKCVDLEARRGMFGTS